MTFVDRRIEPRPTSGEAPFNLSEVFFSRTDTRGVIQSGNYVFRRVAGFDWPELLNAPHKIIRHPDMPKAVFWLLWDRLQKGEAVGAYVKNRAKDGLFYWVYATVVPYEDGYLSARIKPISPLRGVVEQEYAALLKMEQDEGLSPEESAGRLVDRLAELGYDDYNLFATHALSEELIARDAGLNATPDPLIDRFRSMLATADALTGVTNDLIQEFHAMRTTPNNLRVIASRLEPTGGPVTTLSQNYGVMSREMSDWFQAHVLGRDSNFATIKGTVNVSMFLQCMARVLQECDRQLTQERRSLGDIDVEIERHILRKIVTHYTDRSNVGLRQVALEADRILKACNVMNRHVLGLSTTRVMCKIESARLPVAGDSLTDIITQLGVFQERVDGHIEKIAQLSHSILDQIS